MLADLRLALRSLTKSPGFTAVAIFSIALGLGANTAIFSVVNEVFLKPLPVPRPHELVRFEWAGKMVAGAYSDVVRTSGTAHTGASFTLLSFQRFQENNRTLQNLFAYMNVGGHAAVIDGAAETVGNADYVSGDYFTGLHVNAGHGRVLAAADDQPGAPLVAMISHAFWQRRFGGQPDAIGKTISVNRVPVTIVGVTPPEFRGAKSFGEASPLFFPLSLFNQINPATTPMAAQPGNRWSLGIMGRLKSSVTVAEATQNFAHVFQQSALDGSLAFGGPTLRLDEADFPRLSLRSGSNGSSLLRRQAAPQLNVLFGLMGAMLLLACTNVANLLLARGTARRREIAVRLALGAGRWRIVRQLLAESLLLAAGGGVLGAIFAAWGADVLAAMFGFGGVHRVELDWRVASFTALASTLTGVLFGLAPALRATRVDLTAEFQGGPRTIGTGALPVLRLGKLLVAAQVALSFVVLASAGLFLSTVHNLRATDLGFARDRLLLFDLAAGPAGYKGPQRAALFERVADAIRALPGVRAATFSSWPLVAGQGMIFGMQVAGRPSAAGDLAHAAAINDVAPSFFPSYDLPPLLGRTLDARDGELAPKVAGANQTLVQQLFPGENPIGRHIIYARNEVEIVGVVRDIRYDGVREAVPPTLYTAFAQQPRGRVAFSVRTTTAPADSVAAIRRIVREIDPTLPLDDPRTQEEQLERLFGSERMFARLTAVFGVLTLVLVCVGLYGLMSYAVQRRTGEIGVRMALGALPAQVLRMLWRESLVLVGVGVAVGVAAACGATRIIAAMLYGVSPVDPLVYASVAAILAVIASLACLLPARRAAKIDPMVALRAE